MTNIDGKQKILTVADELFASVGFDRTSTRMISERTGLSKSMVHYHFRDKEAVLGELLADYYSRLVPSLVAALEAGTTIGQQWGNLINTYVDFLAQNRNFAVIVQREATGKGPQSQAISEGWGHLMTMLKDTLVQHIKLSSDADLPDDEELRLRASNAIVSFYGMIFAWFTYGDIFGPALGVEPFCDDSIAERKKHLIAVLKSYAPDLGIDLTIALS